ncbi:SRPBCC family protein [Amycolatopsis thermoflava]|uniref:SRPBCC family protein n=1 Tax=Amycolatopsis thermoflava TaxID=84480 RepID=UPI003EB94FB1
MATLRSHVLVDADPDAVWKVVGDAANIADWFPAMTASTGDDTRRTVTLRDGARLEEEVVTRDPVLRRFQYRVVGGDLGVESHLGTVDVIEVPGVGSLVVYSTEIEPASLAGAFDEAISEAVAGLPGFL